MADEYAQAHSYVSPYANTSTDPHSQTLVKGRLIPEERLSISVQQLMG